MSWGYLGDEQKKGRAGRSTGLGGQRNPKPRVSSGSIGYRSATPMGRPSGLSGRLEGRSALNLLGPGVKPSTNRDEEGYDTRFAERDRRASADARRRNMTRMRQQAQGEADEQESPLSFADALMRALGMLKDIGGGASSVNYDPQRARARSQASEADTRLEAMYRQLRGSYNADAPGIGAGYDQAVSGVNQATDQGVENINDAYAKARADQTAQLQALGIEAAAGNIAARGEDAGAQQASEVAGLETNRTANVNQLGVNRRSALDYNTGIGQAAGLEGNLQRAAVQGRLSDILAEIDMAEQQQNAQLAERNRPDMGAAMSLAEALQQDWYAQNPQEQPADWKQQQALAEFLYQQEQDTQRALQDKTKRGSDYFIRLLDQYGGDEERAQQVYNWAIQNGLI